jgi:uncharacterized protein (UPF0264 family)
VLVDTWLKNGATLFDWMSINEIGDLARAVRSAGLCIALAGGLTAGTLEALAAIAPDIVGIRTAACRNAERTAEVCEFAVREFRVALKGLSEVATSAGPPGHRAS